MDFFPDVERLGCFVVGVNPVCPKSENRVRPATFYVPVRRPFSEKEQTPLSPMKPIFEPWDAIPTTPNNLPAARTIVRRELTGVSQNELYINI